MQYTVTRTTYTENISKKLPSTRKSGKWKYLKETNIRTLPVLMAEEESWHKMMLVAWTLLGSTYQVYYLKWGPWDTYPSLERPSFQFKTALFQHAENSLQCVFHLCVFLEFALTTPILLFLKKVFIG